MTPPIVRIEIDHMRQCILHALTEMQTSTDLMVKQAVELACDPATLQENLNRTAQEEINKAVSECVHAFFRHGGGCEVIREIVNKRLTEEYKL